MNFPVAELEKLQQYRMLRRNIRSIFTKTAGFILQVAEVYQNLGKTTDINVLRAENKSLYEDILGENYKVSYANPVYACEKLGQAYGPLLSFLYTELRELIPCAFEKEQKISLSAWSCL